MTSSAPKRFLHMFYGQDDLSGGSYARFPVDELEKVKKILRDNKISIDERIGCCELDGKMCATKLMLDDSGWKSRGFAIRRKNGEPFWNICPLSCAYIPNMKFKNLEEIFLILKENGVLLTLPSYDFEPIPRVSVEEANKHRSDIRGWSIVDSIDIEESLKIEKIWYENSLEKGFYGADHVKVIW